MSVSVSISGADRWRRRLGRGRRAVQPRRLRSNLENAADHVVRRAKANAPVDTGRLRAAIQAESQSEGGRQVVGIGVDESADYARFLEFGTRYISPRLFITRSVEQERGRVREAVEARLQREIG